MKKVFKKGMKVYDEIFFPKEELTIKNVNDDYDSNDNIFGLEVEDKYGGVEIYDFRGYILKEDLYGVYDSITNVPTLSITPYKLEGFN